MVLLTLRTWLRIVFDFVAWLTTTKTNTTASSVNTLMVLAISLSKRIGTGTAYTALRNRVRFSTFVNILELRSWSTS